MHIMETSYCGCQIIWYLWRRTPPKTCWSTVGQQVTNATGCWQLTPFHNYWSSTAFCQTAQKTQEMLCASWKYQDELQIQETSFLEKSFWLSLLLLLSLLFLNRPITNFHAKQMKPPSSYSTPKTKTPLNDQTRARGLY